MSLRSLSLVLASFFCSIFWLRSHTRSQLPLPNHSGYCSEAISRTRTKVSQRMAGGRPLADQLVESVAAGVAGVAQLFLDAQQLVVLGDALGTRQRAGLDLQRVGGDRDIGDGGVLGLARTVRNDGGVAGALGGFDRVEGFG